MEITLNRHGPGKYRKPIDVAQADSNLVSLALETGHVLHLQSGFKLHTPNRMLPLLERDSIHTTLASGPFLLFWRRLAEKDPTLESDSIHTTPGVWRFFSFEVDWVGD